MKLKLIYAIHMLAPFSFVCWHIERLAPDTARALLAFGAS